MELVEVSTFAKAILGSQHQQFYSWLAAIHPSGKCTSVPTPTRDLDSALDWLFRNHGSTANLYLCVNQTTSKQARREQFVDRSNVVYADLDNKIHYSELLVEPTYVTETSPGKYQAFWVLDRPIEAYVTSNISRRIASYHHLDACWDTVRLMRLPNGINFKRVWVGDHRVKIIQSKNMLYRGGDFSEYPKLEFKYIESFQGNITATDVDGVQKYEELDELEKRRIDNYTKGAIEAEIIKLKQLSDLAPGQVLEYASLRGMDTYGWDRGTMWVSRCLTELANAPWNTYTLEQAHHDFMVNAPTDMNWTKNENNDKWQSALNKNCRYGIRFRKYPEQHGGK